MPSPPRVEYRVGSKESEIYFRNIEMHSLSKPDHKSNLPKSVIEFPQENRYEN